MLLNELKKWVKKGGFLFLSSISQNLLSYLVTIFMGEKVLRIVPDGTHDYDKYINIDSVNNIIVDKDFNFIHK